MCKVISSESIIGNLVIEAVAQNTFQIELQKFYDFDKKLSAQLEKHNYFSNFDLAKVEAFQENYPFIVDSMDEEFVHIKGRIENKEKVLLMLSRYFRLGMPTIVIDEMKTISKMILG